MSALREMRGNYLTLRRALGYKLRTDGAGLMSFVSFMEEAQADHITTVLALAWATQPIGTADPLGSAPELRAQLRPLLQRDQHPDGSSACGIVALPASAAPS